MRDNSLESLEGEIENFKIFVSMSCGGQIRNRNAKITFWFKLSGNGFAFKKEIEH